MNKIFVNGHGWSGSSAFIDLLANTVSEDYFLVPGEFDDFRVPGTLRELIESDKLPVSHRKRKFQTLIKLKIRSLINDHLWNKRWADRGPSQRQAKILLKTQKIEKRIFAECINLHLSNKADPRKKLNYWYGELCREFGAMMPNARALIFEQFFLLDDEPEMYDWLEFDKFLLFIRAPSKQLTATLESNTLYNEYPWQVDFLIGSVGKRVYRKQQLFLATTIQRYNWIIDFLDALPKEKVCIVDFDSFLYDFSSTIKKIMDFIDIDLRENITKFSIRSSQSRDEVWPVNSGFWNIEIAEAESAFKVFKEKLGNRYEVV